MNHSGIQLKKIRKLLGLTQQELGEKLGLGKNGVSNIERCTSGLSENVISKLIVDLNVNPKFLFTGIGTPFMTDQLPTEDDISTVRVKLKKGQRLLIDYEN